MDKIVVGCGSGFSSDRLSPAVALAESGRLDFLVFECVGERTLAFGHRDRMLDSSSGYNKLIAPRLRALLQACKQNGTRIVTNMGAANPKAAAEAAAGVARECQIAGVKVAYIEGDDITSQVRDDWLLPEVGKTVGEFGLNVVGANAYLGVEHLLPAIASGADIVITGRFADPSLFMAPVVERFDWSLDDWDRLARGTVAGHLLECGMQVTGGYFADPPYKSVPELARCGYPYAEIGADGVFELTKLESEGGCVTLQTVKEQLLYEVHDPTAYLTPDVTANFAAAELAECGPDRVRVSGLAGSARPEKLKVTVGFDGGYQGEAGVSYAGPGAMTRAELAREILQERLRDVHGLNGQMRIDLLGVSSLHATAAAQAPQKNRVQTEDVRVQVAYAAPAREEAETVLWEVESLLCCGPAGGGGYRGQIVPKVITQSAYVSRDVIEAQTRYIEA